MLTYPHKKNPYLTFCPLTIPLFLDDTKGGHIDESPQQHYQKLVVDRTEAHIIAAI